MLARAGTLKRAVAERRPTTGSCERRSLRSIRCTRCCWRSRPRISATTRRRAAARAARGRRRARRHPATGRRQPRRHGDDRRRRASDLGRRPRARRRGRRGDDERGARRAQSRVRAPVHVVLATLVVGSVALTLFATRLSARIRRLRDEAERAIDAQGTRARPAAGQRRARRDRRPLAQLLGGARAARRIRERIASSSPGGCRTSCARRSPWCAARSTTSRRRRRRRSARVYLERAQGGLDRLSQILTRMAEAARLEQSLDDAERERFDLRDVVAGCVDGYRAAYPQRAFVVAAPRRADRRSTARPSWSRRCSTSWSPTPSNSRPAADRRRVDARRRRRARCRSATKGRRCPEAMRERLFESMVSVRAGTERRATPHLASGSTSCA